MTDVNVTEAIICVMCDEMISTEEDLLAFDKGTCPKCGKNWRNASVSVTGPEAIEGKT
tara:strand:- start:7 stop:180 length:174 start_codon:yes stop_codon:yes gene_type:complete